MDAVHIGIDDPLSVCPQGRANVAWRDAGKI